MTVQINKELNNYIKTAMPVFERNLTNFFRSKLNTYNKPDQKIYRDQLLDLQNFVALEGKFIRPTFSLLGYQLMMDQKPNKDVINASLSLELVHKFLLLHDDIIDSDRVRYGKTNLFGKYEENYKNNYVGSLAEAERYGISISMISGDLGHSFAYEIITRTSLNDALKIDLIKHIESTIEITACGWRVEYENMHKNIKDVEVGQILENLKLITSNYTTEGPLIFGALLTERASKSDLSLLRSFSIPLGVAFQIKDDLMGTFSDAKTSGQEALSDIRAGKKTIQLIEAYKRSSKEDKLFLEKIIGRKTANLKDLKRVRKIFNETGAHQYTLNLARKFVNESLESLSKLKYNNKYKLILEQLAYFVIDREK